jgi:hypothetical protein
MMKTAMRSAPRPGWGLALVTAALAAAVMVLALPRAVRAQTGTTTAPPASKTLPGSVLLFPPVVTGADGAALDPTKTPQVKDTQDIVTDALRKYLTKGGVGVVVYSNRLPSVQRAVAEGQGIKAEVAAKGPGDDPRVAQQLAATINAGEYITASVDNYQYDATAHRATFNLSVTRNDANGKAISSFAEKAVGEAPADVAPSLQEGSAVARAAEVVAEQGVRAIYPQSAPLLNPPAKANKKKAHAPMAWIIPAVAVIGLVAIPR